MSTASSQQEEEYQFSGHSDDDSYSTGGDSGFSVGHDETEKKEDILKKNEQQQQQQQQEEEAHPSFIVDSSSATNSSSNFFSRLASIPIIQDSFMGAQNIVRQHTVGKKALDYAETKLHSMAVSAKPYLPRGEENNTNRILSRANDFGNKSLDLLERRFPSISSSTDQLVQPVAGRIEHAVSHLLEQKSLIVDSRIDYIANGFESLIDQYLPKEEKEEGEEKTSQKREQEPYKELHGMDRLVNIVNILSTRASKKISKKASATMDEEKQIKQMIRAWVLEQANNMAHQPMLQAGMESFKTKFLHKNSPIQVMYNFTQTEFDKVRQELQKPNISHLDRIRNILVLSQTDILMPLYQRSRSMMIQQEPAIAA